MITVGIHGIPDKSGMGHAHDHALSILRNGKVITNIPVERFSRIKHDGNLSDCFDYLLKPFLIENEEIRFILVDSFYGKSFRSSGGNLSMTVPESFLPEDFIAPCKTETKGYLKKHKTTGWVISHELAHIGSCLPFCGEFSDNSLLVHIDGGASVSANSVWTLKKGGLNCLSYDWESLKRVVNYFNASELSRLILGLNPEDHLSMPGKLMGFASHGKVKPEIMKVIQKDSCHITGEGLTESMRNTANPTLVKGSSDFAACMQRDFEDSVLKFFRFWKEKTGCENLYYSGGAALNIHTNVRIENELGFQKVFVPPAPDDSGLALGAASIAELQMGNILEFESPFIVSSEPDTGINMIEADEDIIKEIGKRISEGQIIGTLIGNAECGPRALGHRSILARPDSKELRKHISENMKKREWYRPVSPIMLEETALEVLHSYKPDTSLSRFMSGAWKIREESVVFLKGVIHVDGSVRAQVVRENQDGQSLIYRILLLLKQKYGIYGLLNTSFNQRGEPIIQNFSDAIRSGKAMKLNALFINTYNRSEIFEFK